MVIGPVTFFHETWPTIILPIIFVYHFMQYRVFKGKVREGDAGYHH